MRVLMLTSPKAGSGAGRDEIPRLIELLKEDDVDFMRLETIDQLREELVATPEQTHTILIAAGGDGTLSLAASIVMELFPGDADRVSLLPMPMGTENLLARQFGFTNRAEDVYRTIQAGSNCQLDAGTANGKLFLIMATSGFDADVVRRVHLTRRGHISRLSYLLPIWRALRTYSFPTLRIRVDEDEPIECGWAMVFNLPRYGGNLRIEPEAVHNDGLFDVIAFRGRSIVKGFSYLVQIWLGRHRKDPSVLRLRGKSIEISADIPVPFQLDGDYAGKLPMRLEMLPEAVCLRMPGKADD